jgi:hypothetical protein
MEEDPLQRPVYDIGQFPLRKSELTEYREKAIEERIMHIQSLNNYAVIICHGSIPTRMLKHDNIFTTSLDGELLPFMIPSSYFEQDRLSIFTDAARGICRYTDVIEEYEIKEKVFESIRENRIYNIGSFVNGVMEIQQDIYSGRLYSDVATENNAEVDIQDTFNTQQQTIVDKLLDFEEDKIDEEGIKVRYNFGIWVWNPRKNKGENLLKDYKKYIYRMVHPDCSEEEMRNYTRSIGYRENRFTTYMSTVCSFLQTIFDDPNHDKYTNIYDMTCNAIFTNVKITVDGQEKTLRLDELIYNKEDISKAEKEELKKYQTTHLKNVPFWRDQHRKIIKRMANPAKYEDEEQYYYPEGEEPEDIPPDTEYMKQLSMFEKMNEKTNDETVCSIASGIGVCTISGGKRDKRKKTKKDKKRQKKTKKDKKRQKKTLK